MSSYSLLANALDVHDLITNRRRATLTKPQISRKLRISEKQVTSAIDFLKGMGYPAVYDEELEAWVYQWTPENRHVVIEKELAPRLKKLPKADLGILLMLQRGREMLRSTPLFAEAERFVRMLGDDRLSILKHQLRDMFSYQSHPVVLPDGLFEAVASAVYERQQITFSYQKPEEAKPSLRQVDPHHMVFREEMWYLMGLCHRSGELRTFALTRMKEVVRTGNTFEPVPREMIDEQNEHAFKMVGKGGKTPPLCVRLRFSPTAAVRIKERQWHASQEIEMLPGGGCELSFEVASLSEVAPWVLGWGGHCTVLAPSDLLERVKSGAEEILAKYR